MPRLADPLQDLEVRVAVLETVLLDYLLPALGAAELDDPSGFATMAEELAKAYERSAGNGQERDVALRRAELVREAGSRVDLVFRTAMDRASRNSADEAESFSARPSFKIVPGGRDEA